MVEKSENVETLLTKGRLRKLNALKKSVGPDIAERAFAEWLKKAEAGKEAAVDNTGAQIAEAVHRVLKEKRLSIPRGGYLVRRVRDWVLVERASP